MNNIFLNKKVKGLAVFFLIISILHVIYASCVQRGAIADGSLFILSILDKFSDGNWGFMSAVDCRTRLFVNVMNQLPMNIAYHIFNVDSKYWLSVIYSFPLFFYPFIFVYFNYALAKRSKRYDIAVLGVVLYSVGILLGIMYAVVEIFLAVSVSLLLFHYIVAKINYTKWDIAAVIFLTIMQFNSHELVAYVGYMMFLASLYYAKSEENLDNKKVKYIAGIGSLLASVYLTFWFIFTPNIKEAERFFHDTFHSFIDMQFHSSLLILLFLYLFLWVLFKKEVFSTKNIITISLINLIGVAFMIMHLDIYSSFAFFHYRLWPCIILPVIILYIWLSDVYKIKHSEVFYTNLLAITLCTGIVCSIWQLNNSYRFDKIVDRLNAKIDKVNKTFINPDKDLVKLYNSQKNMFFYCDTYFADSVLFQNEVDINSVIMPSKKEGCPSEFSINEDEETFDVPFYEVSIESKFWDLRNVADKLEEQQMIKEEQNNTLE